MAYYSKDSQQYAKSKKPYTVRIMEVLPETPLNTDEILEYLGVPSNKLTYVIDALKVLLERNQITKIINEKEKRLYAGHFYKRN